MTPYFIVDARPIIAALEPMMIESLTLHNPNFNYSRDSHIRTLCIIYVFRAFFYEYYHINIIDFEKVDLFDYIYNDIKNALSTMMFQSLPYMDFVKYTTHSWFHITYTGKNLFVLSHNEVL